MSDGKLDPVLALFVDADGSLIVRTEGGRTHTFQQFGDMATCVGDIERILGTGYVK